MGEDAQVPAEQDVTAAGTTSDSSADVAADATPLNVNALALYSIQLLGSYAWQAFGLTPDPTTGQIVQNLEQARVAIDCVAGLVTAVEGNLSAEQQRELRSMLQDLRINYVRQLEKSREGSSSQ